MSFKKLTLLFTICVLVACSSDGDNMDGDGIGSVNGNGYSDSGVYSGNLEDLPPGSQEQLVAMIGDRVFFGFNSAALNENAQRTLRSQAGWLQEHSHVTVAIEGHCDERGTREYNLARGERRANAVRNYLVSLGVDAGRISTISYGKEHPEYLGSNEASWSKNRRAVTVVN